MRSTNRTRKFADTIGTIGVLGLGAGAVAACGGPSSPASPPTASSTLQSNGYTPSATYTSDFRNGLGSSSGQVTSSEAGTSGEHVQVVMVMDNSADANTVSTGMQGQYGAYTNGLTTTQNGDVATVTGSLSDFASIGSGS
jgi:hypothetical protein